MRRKILAGALLLSMAGVAWGGWLEDAVKRTGEGIGRRGVGEAGSSTYEGAKDAAKDSDKGTDKAGESQPAPGTTQGAERGPEGKSSAAKGGKAAGDAGAAGDGSIEQAEVVYSKYDFIPGDKVIFFDDFSDTDVGEFPRKWTLNGPKGAHNNTVEVVEYQGKRFLRNNPADKDRQQFESTQYVRLNQKGDLPEKFTVEFDAVFAKSKVNDYSGYYYLLLLNDKDGWMGHNPAHNAGVIQLSGAENISRNTRMSIDKVDGKVHHVALSVNGTFVKAYIDDRRVINDPDGAKRPITMVGLSIYSWGSVPSDKVMFTNFRLAEGGKSIKSALDTDGKIVTHGILFDTGKDVIKPESLPTLKMILGLLNDDSGLKFSIEGHTDNQGNKAINQPLSEKRAAAVKTWLAGKGIEETRLKTKGFGDGKPIDTNGTPEGRANNRRVEFVKF